MESVLLADQWGKQETELSLSYCVLQKEVLGCWSSPDMLDGRMCVNSSVNLSVL